MEEMEREEEEEEEEEGQEVGLEVKPIWGGGAGRARHVNGRMLGQKWVSGAAEGQVPEPPGAARCLPVPPLPAPPRSAAGTPAPPHAPPGAVLTAPGHDAR